MNDTGTVRRSTAIVGALLLMGASAGTTYLVTRSERPSPTPPAPSGPGMTAAVPSTQEDAVELSAEAMSRAGIEVAPVTTSQAGTSLTLVGTVQPNAYKTVVVTPVAPGRVTRVLVELGQQVRVGQIVAHVYSPELADAQTRYLSARAELKAHEQELSRTEKLVEIGSASRQALERLHAEHTAALSMVESNRSRLRLLGMADDAIDSLMDAAISGDLAIVAPTNGTVTARSANPGLNIDLTTPLMTIADLSTVWVMGDLYERDFGAVHVGTAVTVTSAAYANESWSGTIGYIDPQIRPDTRTAQVRAELANPGGRLRFGMFVEMSVSRPSASKGILVPSAAVQVVGDHAVVYVADANAHGRFVERRVRVGDVVGDSLQILEGVRAGEVVVTKGSFAVRAEHERLGLSQAPESSRSATVASSEPLDQRQAARVTVSSNGFEPARVTFRPGQPARLTFVRITDATCATEVVIPSIGLRRQLPLNKPVDIDLPAQPAGEIAFECGMKMFKGAIIVQ